MARFVSKFRLWPVWLCVVISGSLVMWIIPYFVELRRVLIVDKKFFLNEKIPLVLINKNSLDIKVETTFITNSTYLRTVQNAPVNVSKEKKVNIFLKKISRIIQNVNSLNVNIRNIIFDHLRGIKNFSVVNPHPFSYLHLPKPCAFPSGKLNHSNLLILVKSAVGNKGLRDGIRNTWGKRKHPTVNLVFLLGYTKTSHVENESLVNRDIIQEDFVDAYQNNTYKTIMGFNWGIINCSAAQFYFFVDDDHMVNLPNLLSYIHELTISNNSTGKKSLSQLFAGGLLHRSKPSTNPSSKWYIPRSEYRDNYWPPFLAGGAYIMSRSVALRFYLAFPYVKFIRIDDAYLGIVAKRLGISPIRETRFQNTRKGLLSQRKTDFFAAHGFDNAKDMTEFWTSYHKQKI